MPTLFPFYEYWWLYAAFTAGVLMILALDLGVLHRDPRPVPFREAAAWSAAWISLALLFSVGLYVFTRLMLEADPQLAAIADFDARATARRVTLEFLTGYVVEYSLSIDNIFVFYLVLGYFGVPAQYQHRVLFYGILGALVFRAVFIALGALLMQVHWIVWLFGLFLIVTGVKLGLASDALIEPDRNLLVRTIRRVLPVTGCFHGEHFFVREHGRLMATPLFVALICLETSDIVFAVDSVPAIFALTREPFLVFTSNVFAILGLRSMYFMLGGAAEQFKLLRYGLAMVLVFVGMKMVWLDQWYGDKFPISWSLGIIASIIAMSILLSWLLPRRKDEVRMDARSGTVER